jgi:hypothetical protein
MIFVFFHAPARATPTAATLKEKLLQMDLPGTFTVMAAVICYILALQWGGQGKAWSSSEVIGTLVGFVLISMLFLVIEYYQGERAIIVGRLLKNRTVSVGMAYVFFLAGGFFLLLYYIPIYFQVVSGVSASQSGIRNLPLILGCTITTILCGGLISAYGHFVPFMIIGAAGGTIGSGLLYTLSPTSSSSQWIGYQALAGLSIGFSLQIPVISGQAVVAPSDLASATAMILFCQTIGGAFFVSAGQSAFTNIMVQRLPTHAPDVDVAKLLGTGITDLRDVFPPEDIPGIVDSYMGGLKVAYAVAIAATGISVLISLASKWRNLKGKVVVGAAA